VAVRDYDFETALVCKASEEFLEVRSSLAPILISH